MREGMIREWARRIFLPPLFSHKPITHNLPASMNSYLAITIAHTTFLIFSLCHSGTDYLYAQMPPSINAPGKLARGNERQDRPRTLEKVRGIDFVTEVEGIKGLQFTGNGSNLIVETMSQHSGWPMRLYYLNASNGKSVSIADPLTGLRGAVGYSDNRCLWTLEKEGHLLIESLTVDPDGMIDMRVKHSIKLPEPERFDSVVAVSLKQRFFVERSKDEELRIVDLKSGQTKQVLEMNVRVEAVALSEDGKLLSACGMPIAAWTEPWQMANSNSSFVFVWDTESGKLIYERNLGYRVFTTKFSKDNSLVLCSGWEDGHEGDMEVPIGHVDVVEPKKNGWSSHYLTDSYILCADFVNQDEIVIGLGNGRVQILDYRQGKQITEVQVNPWHVSSIAVHGDLLATGAETGEVSLWRLSHSKAE
ncbi:MULTISPECIES: WD40 repeat domain-containing protein [Pirellulaceae]|uniref:WD40 repeat domain-containing protein n=1 Tax=Pirellulaceae TaxID=2691357 RepID=UPI0011B02A5E|nr:MULTISPECIES: hypothetical protein [Pirellulaceae]